DVKCLGFLYLYVGRYPRNNASRNSWSSSSSNVRVQRRQIRVILSGNMVIQRPYNVFSPHTIAGIR
ncbi:MAG: hypothetical protein BECKG1743E_GA0114224_112952, partial [Candidatus Kentron sp. G]